MLKVDDANWSRSHASICGLFSGTAGNGKISGRCDGGVRARQAQGSSEDIEGWGVEATCLLCSSVSTLQDPFADTELLNVWNRSRSSIASSDMKKPSHDGLTCTIVAHELS